MTHIKTAIIVLITAMILSLALTYASLLSIVSSTKSNTERVLDSFVLENSTYVYDSIKNGHDFTSSIDEYYYIGQTGDSQYITARSPLRRLMVKGETRPHRSK